MSIETPTQEAIVVALLAALLGGCCQKSGSSPPLYPVDRDIRDTQKCEGVGMVATRGSGLNRRVDGGIVCEPKVKP